MAIRIGHASIDEHGKAKGGASGDQTGREVTIRTWYSKPWGLVLRCKDAAKAEKMAAACEKGCANSNIGYDQNQRNTLNTQAEKVGYDLAKIKAKCETDCSAFMTVCAQAAGIDIPYTAGNAPTTSTMREAFTSTGMFDVLTDSKYLTSDKFLRRGDIMVKPGSHTAMALDNGENASTAQVSQGGAYTREQFIKDVQAAIGAKVDGIAGAETLSKTVTVSATKNRTHAVVRPIQRYLDASNYPCGAADGIAGPKFTSAVRAYQRMHGCEIDGEITARNNTWKKLLGLA